MQWNELDQQPCSVARTLSVIGDRWTILVLRDCFLRIRRFEDFQQSLGIARPILADRLQKLVDSFVLTRVAYQEKPARYEYRLTPKGMELYPVVMSIVRWGDTYMADKKGPPIYHRHQGCGHRFHILQVCSECSEEIRPREVTVERNPMFHSKSQGV